MRFKKHDTNFPIVGVLLLAAILLPLIINGARWPVRGQVVDADTGKPIQGAAIAIQWWAPSSGFPGFNTSKDLTAGEDVSNANGNFTIPKYSTLFSGKHFRMAVYKEGYVCWSSSGIFPYNKDRKGFIPEFGMKIEMEPFRTEYSKKDHALFVTAVMPLAPLPLFEKAIKSERKLAIEVRQKATEKGK